MYKLLQSEYFERLFEKGIPDNLKEDVKRRILKLREYPYSGKPLSFDFLRELKAGKFRVYYSVYENEVTVLLITVGDKRMQKETINIIKKEREKFKRYVQKYIKEGD